MLSRRKVLLGSGAVILTGTAGLVSCTQLTGGTDMMQLGGLSVTTLTVPINNSHLVQKGEAAIHGHHDHAGGALHFRETYGTPIIAGAGDVPLIEAGRNDHLCPTGPFAELRLERDQAGTYEGYTPDRALSRVTSLSNYGIPLTVHPIAGHTAGSLVVTGDRVAFVGDMFRGTLPPGGAEVHFYMCDQHDNAGDIINLLARTAPTAERFFTGHFQSMPRSAVHELAMRLLDTFPDARNG